MVPFAALAVHRVQNRRRTVIVNLSNYLAACARLCANIDIIGHTGNRDIIVDRLGHRADNRLCLASCLLWLGFRLCWHLCRFGCLHNA